MGMVVQHNMNALNAYNKLNVNVTGMKKSSEKLSSGYRINRAGDDAAGLAISEKMRSQIKGLNQAVRNSQDGINMIQTFEGAAQETHSILQRMKELASESANGTYDNATDRAAIQLEFEQLNDELNQIADTDFNGTVVLNGGEMADGLKQVDGNFDYRMKADQVAEANAKALADGQAAAQAKIDRAQKVFNNAKINYENAGPRDLSNNGNALQWKTVDNSNYDLKDADMVFSSIKDGTDSLKTLGIDEVNVTFTATVATDGTVTWEATRAFYTDATGAEKDATITTDTFGTGLTGNSNEENNGGFDVTFGTGAVDSNGTTNTDTTTVLTSAVIDASNVKNKDTVTLKFTNAVDGKVAPDEIAFKQDSVVNTTGLSNDGLTISLAPGISDTKMNEQISNALKDLEKATFSYSYNGKAVQNIQIENGGDLTVDTTLDDKGAFNVYYKDSEGNDALLATITPAAGITKGTGAAKTNTANDVGATANPVTGGSKTFTWKDGAWDDGAGNTTANIGKNNNADVSIDPADYVQGTFNEGDTVTIKATAGKDANDDTKNILTYSAQVDLQPSTVGSVKFQVATSYSEYNKAGMGPTITASKDTKITVDTKAIDLAYADAKKALDDAKASYPKTLEDLGISTGVTKADAYDNSTARLTYTDNITLQTGARTKDAVNFTFSYNRDGSADMGDLKANLNLSSRADGLNTANLSLATQKDANYAIDQIDKAINKTSMVRATFGSIQNRLEHKITNLTTTSENLQEAESSIRDTDMASEMMNYTKYNILQQAAQSMLAQANQQPQSILQLLG